MNLSKTGLIAQYGGSLLLFGLSSGLFAAELGGDYKTLLCPQSLNIPARPTVDADLGTDDTFLTADEADLIEDGVSTLTGNAEVTRNLQQVTADTIIYDQPNDTADLEGNVNYWDEDVFLNSDDAFLQFDNGVGEFSDADYTLIESRGRGTAEKMVLDVGTRTDMETLQYTTCDPDDEFWKFSASSLTLDHENNWGKARNVVIRIKDVPVFYSPYMSFPLSKERKSGFLAPSYGTTNRNGFELRTPYYWNIRPNMDATLTPRILTDSGVMAMGEYRYLYGKGNGVINAEYLPSDNNRGDDHRNLIGIKLNQRVLSRGNFYLDYNRVSDKFYFEDFGTQLSTTSTRFLEQRGDITYTSTHWNTLVRIQNFQIVDRSLPALSRPYKRLPQILFNYHSGRISGEVNYGMNSELVYFDRGGSDILLNNVNGLRVDLNPFISYPIITEATFFEPKLRFRYTQYNLEDNALFKSSPSRLLPLVSLDSGVFLERDINLFNKNILQTLEPRIYYLYVPNEDQSDLPRFDTAEFTFSFASLFREDRFSNADRMGDTNQITLAVTSNHISKKTGRNLGYLRLGQIFYFQDRRVSLTAGAEPSREGQSPIVAQFGFFPIRHLRVVNDFQWDPGGEGTERFTTSMVYNPSRGKVLNMKYRNHRGVDQSDISFRWPITKNWSAVGRWNYAIPEGRSLEIFGGIEYDSCCWGVRAVARRFLADINGEFEAGIFLQMELKGLAGVGKKTVDFLRQQIPGYQSDF